MSTLVNIGEFARLSHMSVKALRHYHDIGLLVPAEISPTGYRRYDVEQVGDAHLIRRLRALDMPLPDIDVVLAAPETAEREAVLADHLRRMEGELERTRAIVTSLRDMLERPIRDLDVTIRREDATPALVRRGLVASTEIETWSTATFAQLDSAIGARRLERRGAMGSLFSSDFFERGVGEVTSFAPLELAQVGRARAGQTPGLELLPAAHYAVTTHIGPYHDLDRTYGALGSYVARHFVASPGPIREHYVVSAADIGAPAELRTDLLWPIAIDDRPQ